LKNILYLVRTEADFERVVALAIAGKNKYKQHFIFVGDFSPFYSDGIENKFQKALFQEHGFTVRDFYEYDIVGRVLKKLIGNQNITINKIRENKKLILPCLFNALLNRYGKIRKCKIIANILKEIIPDALLTDQSITDKEYLPEIFRTMAYKMGIPSFIFTHGAAGGLHSAFSSPASVDEYGNCTVFICSRNEPNAGNSNVIILGDIASSYSYVHYLNNLEIHDIHFLDERKYKVGFMVGGTGPLTSTTGWHIMEEIIIDLSENKDVAIVLKLHPREAPFIDLRMLNTFDNLLIVNKETDRSRVSKWADIVVCNDHCSTIFAPMILGKKVVAIEGRHIPKYKSHHSPLKKSSVNYISSADEFDLESLGNSDSQDSVTNIVAWGENGPVDLAEMLLERIAQLMRKPNMST